MLGCVYIYFSAGHICFPVPAFAVTSSLLFGTVVIVSFVILFRNYRLRERLLAMKMLTCNCFENLCKSPPRRGKYFRFLSFFIISWFNCSYIHFSSVFKLLKIICLNLHFSWSSATKNKVWYLEDTQIIIGTTVSSVCCFMRIWGNKHCGKNFFLLLFIYLFYYFCSFIVVVFTMTVFFIARMNHPCKVFIVFYWSVCFVQTKTQKFLIFRPSISSFPLISVMLVETTSISNDLVIINKY